MLLREIEPAEVYAQFPPIVGFDAAQLGDEYDSLFICALGFEERSLAVPEALRRCGKYRSVDTLVLGHETNKEDNAKNLAMLRECLGSFSTAEPQFVQVGEDFTALGAAIKRSLSSPSRTAPLPIVTLDISGLSSRMLLTVLRLLFSERINLRILYAEAKVYHPTIDEYRDHPEDWTVDGIGMSKGITRASELNLYSNNSRRELSIMLVAFPTFKPERIRSIQAELQPALSLWVLGIPHASENRWRTQAMREINGITESDMVEELPTFGYVDAFSLLERIYREHGDTFHIFIAPHGSKLNNLGVALFCQLRQDVGLWFSNPMAFTPSQYTGSVERLWQIRFDDVQQTVNVVRSCGKLVLQTT